jgi:hypothetical protein
MKKRWERREILKTLAAASAHSTLGTGGRARAEARAIATVILKNGKFTTLDSSKPNVCRSQTSFAGAPDHYGVNVWAEPARLGGPEHTVASRRPTGGESQQNGRHLVMGVAGNR